MEAKSPKPSETASERKSPEKSSLAPDHPLLQRFQKALKEHLLTQISRLEGEIFESESEAKKKNAEREQLGVQTYEAQQLVCSQHKVLENIVADLQTVTAAKEEMEAALEEEKQKQKGLREKIYLTEKSNRELQNEIESINYLIHQMSQWENKIESNISVNQRIAEKTRKDNLLLAQEKRAQDLLIYNLMREIWRLEGEIEAMEIQTKVQSSEIEEQEEAIAVGNTNVEALQAEYRCLMHSWNSVVVAISNRSKTIDCLNEEVNRMQENLKSITAETEQVKKLTKKELIENERRTVLKNRIEQDIKYCKAQTDEEMKKRNAIERNMLELQAISEQTEKDIESVRNEIQHRQTYLDVITKDYDKIVSKKTGLEEKLLKNLQNQLANDKAAVSLYRMLRAIKDKTKDVEVIMNEAENKRSRLIANIESQKYNNYQTRGMLQDLQKQQADLEKETDALQEEKAKYDLLFRKRERQYDYLNSKIEKATIKDHPTISPQEVRLTQLEKQIEETQESIKKLQLFWLREQKNLLVVSKDRQEQIYNINMLKKQSLILEQKNLRIRDEIEAYKKAAEKVLHNINSLQNRSTVLSEVLFKKRHQKTNLDRNNVLLQSEYDTKLRDADLACLEIEADVTDIEEDRVNLSKNLVEVNREVLEWEKKLQLVKETLSNVKEERSESGEVGNMRQEIHKMQVIYGQLRRAQEKLVKDLDHCVGRRESIYMVSEARQKKTQGAAERTRVNYSRKMDNVKNKIKQMESETESLKLKCRAIEEQKENLLQGLESTERNIKMYENYSSNLSRDVEISKTSRQMNFELLLVNQKKVSLYHDISVGRQPFLMYKTEDQLATEYTKQKDLSNKLGKIVENLTVDFPNYKQEFDRVYNSLRVSALLMY
ncbi:coiled-coil domain-containing protein 40 [Anoplophora glabripennis]|uniref:coiled-coil domain-containing protein 40 n=1 Tax=Anoplophora glabripennis TaxID=217634 RepID=UPI000873B669|nr:coiled-coil domain-containing protein 40 [Anoplophora glabripennis]